jgi:multidrug efflux pump subunit AcrB
LLAFRSVGQELFPEVDASEFTIHLRAVGGPRVEETERQVAEIEQMIRDVVPAEDLELIQANIGISSRWSAIYTPNNGPHAAFIRVQLRSGFSGRSTPTLTYLDELREQLRDRFPGDDFFYESGGMIRRILNAGALAPIEVQVHGRDNEERRRVTRLVDTLLEPVPGIRDTYIPQGMDLPQLRVVVDRMKAARPKLTETDVVRNVITALMSSAQLAPNFWIDPLTGNPYVIGVQYPEYVVNSLQTLEQIPITPAAGAGKDWPLLRLEDVATIERSQGPVEVYHHNASRVSQLFINVADNDLAGVAKKVDSLVARRLPLAYAIRSLPSDRAELADNEEFRDQLKRYLSTNDRALGETLREKYKVDPQKLKMPRNIRVEVRGEVSSMRESFREMLLALALALALVYLVMAAQFSSWLDPFITIVAAPLGLIGVAFALWLTGTSLNIQSCMGILMMVGISVSNSVLLVDFANRQRESGLDPLSAVISAARTRLRPILMTTLATILGLLPMAIHLRPGDEMNLPLARAVIGGLTGSMLLTLFVVPVLYTLLERRRAVSISPLSPSGERGRG